jgi:hypothetical protein
MKLGCAAAAIALAAFGFGHAAQATPVQWSGNGHYYELITTALDYDQADAAASASTYNGLTGYLATISSSAENTFVANLIQDTVGNDQAEAYIGSSNLLDGQWRFSAGPENGQLMSFLSFEPGEPNNAGGSEHYLELYGYSLPDGPFAVWNDVNGALAFRYVVEYGTSVAQTPLPATLPLMASALGGLGFFGWRRRTLNAL